MDKDNVKNVYWGNCPDSQYLKGSWSGMDVRAIRFLETNVLLGSWGGMDVLLVFIPENRRTYMIRQGRTSHEPALAIDMASSEVTELGQYYSDIVRNCDELRQKLLEVLHIVPLPVQHASVSNWLAE